MLTSSKFSVSLRLCGMFLVLAAYGLPLTAQIKDFARWVDPFIGTGGHGHTFPGAVAPFGMVQLSPDTREANWDGSSGYHYSDDIIYGFSHTHLSGTGIPDGCDILFMPTTKLPDGLFAKDGDKYTNNYSSKFSHINEKAEPGYYAVKLGDGIFVELTTTQRVGFHRYTFPANSDAKIILDLMWRDKTLGSQIDIKGKRIEGWRRSTSWAKNQTVYFVAEFSERFGAPFWGPDSSLSYLDHSWRDSSLGEHIRVAFPFDPPKKQQILLKVGISFVSIEGARKNLEAELPDWDFDKVRADAKSAWNKELSKIEVSGGTDAQTTTFYTALYHTMIHPSIFSDVDGNYRGLDGKVHNVLSTGFSRPNAGDKRPPKGGTQNQYTVFSLWDTFRAAHPLYTIIDQKRTVDFINSFIGMYEQGGRLPVWELWGNETDCMIGYHAVSVIADAMAKGIKGFDYEKAYEAAKHSAELDRDGLAAYKKRGYISMEDENESVSKTLEYAYDDWCIAQMAKKLYDENSKYSNIQAPAKSKLYRDDIERFSKRAFSFENLFDPETGFMRPRANGGFLRPFAPNDVTFNYTEGNAWQYSFFVPHRHYMMRLAGLMGGNEKLATKLDELFTTSDKLTGREQPDITGLIGQYAHGNEPSHHIAYLYNFANQPWKTQKYVRQILDDFYKPTPAGLIGNEDCGQMSAWYVLSASGFYPVTPGNPEYGIGTPLFPEIRYHLENGKTFTIKANGASTAKKYIRSAKLNGANFISAYLWHEDISQGGLLEFEMSDSLVKGVFAASLYFDSNTFFVAVPIIGDGRRTFRESYTFTIKSITPDAKVYYTLDGSEPTEKSTVYASPLTITADTTVKAIVINKYGLKSQVTEAHYHRLPNDWTVKIDSKYNRQYTGGGDNGLIDGIRGTTNFASGEWQGYQAQDFVATIDLQKETEIGKVGGGFLQNAGSWIWMPTHIEFEVSSDNVNFSRVADIKTDIDPKDMESKIRDYMQSISPVRARYVRVHAYNLGKIPAWHPGAGDEAFIFVDEIFVQ